MVLGGLGSRRWLCAGRGGVSRRPDWPRREPQSPKSLCVPSARRPGSHLQLASPVALGPFGAILIGDLQLEFLGVLDPPDHEFLGGEETDELLLLVGLRHRLGEVGGLAIAQLTHRVHAGFVQQLDIAFAHALDAHVVASIGEFQQPLLVDAGPFRQQPATLRACCRLKKPLGGADAERFERFDLLRLEIEVGNGISHRILLSSSEVHRSLPQRQMNWPRPGIAPTISPTASSPTFSRAKAIVSRVTAWTWPMLRPAPIMRVPAASAPLRDIPPAPSSAGAACMAAAAPGNLLMRSWTLSAGPS